MCCTFEKFDSNLLSKENAIAYKYVVKCGHLDEVEECIHSSSGDLRRCLKISSKVFSGVKSKNSFLILYCIAQIYFIKKYNLHVKLHIERKKRNIFCSV